MDHCTDAISSIKRLYRFIQWYQSSDTRKSCLDYALFLKNKTRNMSRRYKSTGHEQLETALFSHTGDNNQCC